MPKKSTTINRIFNIIGDAEAAANLLNEFKIAEKKDDKLTKKRNGKVNLVKLIAKFNFSSSPEKPGAIKKTKIGMNISISKTIDKRLNVNKLKTWFAKLSASSFPFESSDA